MLWQPKKNAINSDSMEGCMAGALIIIRGGENQWGWTEYQVSNTDWQTGGLVPEGPGASPYPVKLSIPNPPCTSRCRQGILAYDVIMSRTYFMWCWIGNQCGRNLLSISSVGRDVLLWDLPPVLCMLAYTINLARVSYSIFSYKHCKTWIVII